MRFISLQTKLMVSIVGLAVLVTLGPGWWMVAKSYGALRLQAQEGQLALARSLAAQVDQSMSQAIQALEVLAKRPALEKMDPQALPRELALVSSATEIFDGLCVMLPDGTLRAFNLGTALPNLPPPSTYRAYFRLTRKAGEPVLSETYKTATGDLAAVLNAPIYHRKKMVGMVMGVLLLSNLGVGNLEDIKIGPNGYAYLVDEKGLAVVHPHRNKLLADFSSNPAVKGLITHEEGVAEFKGTEDNDVLAAYAKVDSVNWGVVVRQPTADCYQPADRMLRFLMVSLALVVLGSVLLALALARRLVQPLLALARQAQGFEAGRWDPTELKRIQTGDEVGLVAQAFLHMAQALRSQQLERERAHARVLAAEKKLAESERLALVGQLSAGLAHELNNPLAIILGSAQEVSLSAAAATRPWLERIQREAARCQRLVKDLLNFSRPIVLRRRRVALGGLVSQAWSQAMHGRSVPYHLKMAATPVAAWVDADRFKQVFINLLGNCMDAMPQGGRVEVRLREQAGMVRVWCKDQGQGFPDGDLERLFRPFFTTKAQGTGLGLAITRSIVQAHGGTVRAQKPRGQGAVFVLDFPAIKPKP